MINTVTNTINSEAPSYLYIAPSGVIVTSCKPEPQQRGPINYLLWSYRNWGKKIIRTQLNRFRRV